MTRPGSALLCFGAAITAGCFGDDSAYRVIQLSESGAGAYETAMASYRGGAAVAWYDVRDGNGEIYLRLVGPEGDLGLEYRLTDDADDSYEVSIAAAGDALAIAWYGKSADDTLRSHIGLWEPSAGWLWREAISPDRRSRNPVVRASGDSIFGAWIEGETGDESIRFAVWEREGRRQYSPVDLGEAGPETWNLNAAVGFASETVFVTYDAPSADGTYELFVAEIRGRDAVRQQLSASDGFTSKYPDIALADVDGRTRVALTWFDEKDGNLEAYLATADLSELADRPVDAFARRASYSEGPTIGSYVAWNDSRIGLAWSDQVAGRFDVMFQSFDSDGTALGEVEAITATDLESFVPAIVPWGNGFAMAWNEYAPGTPVDGALHASDYSEVFFATHP